MLVRRPIALVLLVTALGCQSSIGVPSASAVSERAEIKTLLADLWGADRCSASRAYLAIYQEGPSAIPALLAHGADRRTCRLLFPQSRFLSTFSAEHPRGLVCLYLIEAIRIHQPVHGGCSPLVADRSDVRRNPRRNVVPTQAAVHHAYKKWYSEYVGGNVSADPGIVWEELSELEGDALESEFVSLNCLQK